MASEYVKSEDFIGRSFNNGKLKVVGIHGNDGHGHTTFKVTCSECSKDPELFPDGYFISTKSSLKKGQLPCGCAKHPYWTKQQYLIKAKRSGKDKNFNVEGYAEEFHGVETKVNCKCLIDNYEWAPTLHGVINSNKSCPSPSCKAEKSRSKQKTSDNDVLARCKSICNEMNYTPLGFLDGYDNCSSKFYYVCEHHGEQKVRYSDFVTKNSRCPECWKEKRRQMSLDSGNGNGFYPTRAHEKDFLYTTDFDGKFVKVGRSFNIPKRIKSLKTKSKIRNIFKLRIYTATHKEVYDLEQELHEELRSRNFQYYTDWSTETFENDCLYILNKLLDNCGFERIL